VVGHKLSVSKHFRNAETGLAWAGSGGRGSVLALGLRLAIVVSDGNQNRGL